PPLAEQRRIVGKLELLLGKVSSSQQRLSRVPGLLKRFRQSVLAAACSGKLTADWREENEAVPIDSPTEIDIPTGFPTLPESWSWTTLESVCVNVVDCPHSTPKWTDAGKLCIRTTNFRPGILDLSEVRFVSAATFNERIERLRPEPGDIVYSREGGILGIACQIPPSVQLCLGQRMMLFRVGSEYTATLLMHWLNSSVITHRVQELTGGSASPHLNVRDIKAFPTPLPPLSEQQEIVRRVEKLFAFADQIEARLRQAQAHVDRLTQSLLAKAFRGELVPTEHTLAEREHRSYEPAADLLKRIRSAQQSNTPASLKSNRKAKSRVPKPLRSKGQ
ncbi:MAG: restriction endonuclease subunit S, partial [Planctomycetaceae bacterium]|nr:restriction endonuclease subunit S [Planctomycetaceae bacterium]